MKRKKQAAFISIGKALAVTVGIFLGACARKGSTAPLQPTPAHPAFSLTTSELAAMANQAGPEVSQKAQAQPYRFLDLLHKVLTGDPELVRLVDKKHPLPREYHPEDLVPLHTFGVRTSRAGLQLRKNAAMALSEMASEARRSGIELLVSSAYRSYAYQATVYQRVVNAIGQEAADRESARPGFSQHQLGTAVDFGSISDAFTGTPMERWLYHRAWEFGFSLSYPEGKEAETGYRHESWHYRYIGKEAARLEREFFGGSQQRLLEFLHKNSESLRKALRAP